MGAGRFGYVSKTATWSAQWYDIDILLLLLLHST